MRVFAIGEDRRERVITQRKMAPRRAIRFRVSQITCRGGGDDDGGGGDDGGDASPVRLEARRQ